MSEMNWIVEQVEHQTSYMDLSICHQKKDPSVALGTPSVSLRFYEYGGLVQNKEYSLGHQLFEEKDFHIIYIFV